MANQRICDNSDETRKRFASGNVNFVYVMYLPEDAFTFVLNLVLSRFSKSVGMFLKNTFFSNCIIVNSS